MIILNNSVNSVYAVLYLYKRLVRTREQSLVRFVLIRYE